MITNSKNITANLFILVKKYVYTSYFFIHNPEILYQLILSGVLHRGRAAQSAYTGQQQEDGPEHATNWVVQASNPKLGQVISIGSVHKK